MVIEDEPKVLARSTLAVSDIVVQVDNLAKQYRIGSGHARAGQIREKTLRDQLADTVRASLHRAWALLHAQAHPAGQGDKTIWALKDVSFTIRQGEVVGIIGRNGAGKSTLLKILARITEPTYGEAVIHGRIGSLLEVGTGFHYELTGRENIYLNGAILGMKRREIERNFDEIVDFSGVEQFIDTPVKHYSSGMRMRLAFSVAAHLNPEILLVDEVLSVGDAQFREKSLGKMNDVAQSGRTVILVSHNMTTMLGLCDRILYLKDGLLQMDAGSEESIACYMAEVQGIVQIPLYARTDRLGSGQVRVTDIRWLDAKTHLPLDVLLSGQAVYLVVSYESSPDYRQPLQNLEINVSICTQLNQYVIALNSRMASNAFDEHLPPSGKLYCYLERFPLMPGRYSCNCQLKLNGARADQVRNAFMTEVEAGDFFGTGFAFHHIRQSVYVPHQWLSMLPPAA